MSAKIPVRAIVNRRFDHPAERVFDAWLHPEWLEQWMFGPAVRDEEIVHLAVDPRVGGAFSFLVERAGEEINHVGRYLEVERPHRLVFTWMVAGEPMGSRVLIDIVAQRIGCALTLTHELHPAWSEFTGKAADSWRVMLEALATALENAETPRR